jgi:hypothetical protein
VRRLRIALIALAAPVLLGACTPEQFALFDAVTTPTREVLSDEQLHRLRMCESRDDYGAVSRSGTYRGAYQFSQSTWNGVAERHYPWLVGVDPATADFYWQDAMARALYSEAGRSPWPHCGRRV